MSLKLYQGESRLIRIRIKDEDGKIYPIHSDAVIFIGAKRDSDDPDYTFSIDDSEIDKSQGEQGLIIFTMTVQTDILPGFYKIQIKITSNGETIKTATKDFEIEQALV